MVPEPGHEAPTSGGSDESIGCQIKNKKGLKDSTVVRWLNKQADRMDKHWTRLPNFAGSAAATCAIFLLGLCYRGEWMLIFVHFARRFGYGGTPTSANVVPSNGTDTSASIKNSWEQLLSEVPYIRNFSIAWMVSVTVSYSVYFTVCGFLHWYYYVRQRDKATEWKCQPYKWLAPKLEKHEIILGVSSLFFTNTLTSLFATYVLHDGPSMIYFGFDEYTWLWWFLQWPIMYLILAKEHVESNGLMVHMMLSERMRSSCVATGCLVHLPLVVVEAHFALRIGIRAFKYGLNLNGGGFSSFLQFRLDHHFTTAFSQ